MTEQTITPHVHPDLAGLWPGPELPGIRVRVLNCAAVPVAEAAKLGERILTAGEKARAKEMGDRRRAAFIAARAALKMLHYNLGCAGPDKSPAMLETAAEDGRPLAPQFGEYPVYVSASHDAVWAVAAAGRGLLGLDVEPLSDKALRGGKVFMSDAEKKLVKDCGLPDEEAALRIWSAKEAAAKAFNLELAKSWSKVTALEIGEHSSVFMMYGQRSAAAHETLDQHLFTLFPA